MQSRFGNELSIYVTNCPDGMDSNPQNSNGDSRLPMKINLPKTGLFHFGILWGLTPTGLLLLLHISMMWDDFVDLAWHSTCWIY